MERVRLRASKPSTPVCPHPAWRLFFTCMHALHPDKCCQRQGLRVACSRASHAHTALVKATSASLSGQTSGRGSRGAGPSRAISRGRARGRGRAKWGIAPMRGRGRGGWGGLFPNSRGVSKFGRERTRPWLHRRGPTWAREKVRVRSSAGMRRRYRTGAQFASKTLASSKSAVGSGRSLGGAGGGSKSFVVTIGGCKYRRDAGSKHLTRIDGGVGASGGATAGQTTAAPRTSLALAASENAKEPRIGTKAGHQARSGAGGAGGAERISILGVMYERSPDGQRLTKLKRNKTLDLR